MKVSGLLLVCFFLFIVVALQKEYVQSTKQTQVSTSNSFKYKGSTSEPRSVRRGAKSHKSVKDSNKGQSDKDDLNKDDGASHPKNSTLVTDNTGECQTVTTCNTVYIPGVGKKTVCKDETVCA